MGVAWWRDAAAIRPEDPRVARVSLGRAEGCHLGSCRWWREGDRWNKWLRDAHNIRVRPQVSCCLLACNSKRFPVRHARFTPKRLTGGNAMDIVLSGRVHRGSVGMAFAVSESAGNVVVARMCLHLRVGDPHIVEPNQRVHKGVRELQVWFGILVGPVIDCKRIWFRMESRVADRSRILGSMIQVDHAAGLWVATKEETGNPRVETHDAALSEVFHQSATGLGRVF